MLITHCLCGSADFTPNIINEIPVNTCNNCNIVHQRLDITEQEYFNFYSTDYHDTFQKQKGVTTFHDRYQHDLEISNQRYKYYKPYIATVSGKPALDIGSSNNAFVNFLRSNSIDAYGVEIGSEGALHPHTTYHQDLLNINFPGSYFGFITLHDVFEHLINPTQYLKKINNIVASDGITIIDVPDFFHPTGIHHWKHTEHLWMLNTDQYKNVFRSKGFDILRIYKPIPSKLVFILRKTAPSIQPTKLLFMPGMGDIYWGLTKVESFIKKHNLDANGTPESYIWDVDQKIIKGKQRSEGFLNRVTFMDYKGTFDAKWNSDFDQFYKHKAPKPTTPDGLKLFGDGNAPVWVLPKVSNGTFDYMFNMNGVLEIGDNILDSYDLSNYETNWDIELFTPLNEYRYEQEYKERFGKYMFCYFTGNGVYDKRINSILTPSEVYSILYEVYKKTGIKTVIVGTDWDAENSLKIKALDKHNIIFYEVGNTDTSQMFAMIKGSVGIFGWPAGNTIVGASIFKKPTVMVWTREIWHENFPKNCIDPELHDKSYWWYYADEYGTGLKSSIIDRIVTNFK